MKTSTRSKLVDISRAQQGVARKSHKEDVQCTQQNRRIVFYPIKNKNSRGSARSICHHRVNIDPDGREPEPEAPPAYEPYPSSARLLALLALKELSNTRITSRQVLQSFGTRSSSSGTILHHYAAMSSYAEVSPVPIQRTTLRDRPCCF